ncbi:MULTISPECIES: hypothetical protein [unclassified Rhizobium]|uniref:hypothetical protein n=1 Tax=unclassified Rhizobium TaxID=2613769 RepID=UPI000BCFD031|nr:MULTISPECIES: hypothetical protein [unclassified Rhizobium]MDH7809848.1 hypothetical protein [Rhizobium sp. AN67]MDQ4406501.1 hypothetical protein [Rhizobium sp. AN63]SOD56310.1 hypothetical protein SAMN05216595_3007 [Rhizobium sp. AN6A]
MSGNFCNTLSFTQRVATMAVGIFLIAGNLEPAFAIDMESRALWAASAMAEADYHRSNPCKQWKVDEQAVKKVIAWSGRTLEELRASEDYQSQRDAIAGVARQYGADMTCDESVATFDVDEHDYGVLRHSGW